MERIGRMTEEDTMKGFPTIAIPSHVPASEEEKARRRVLGKEVERLRELAGSIGISSSDLIRQVRDEAEDLT